jgi:hypothetical protein
VRRITCEPADLDQKLGLGSRRLDDDDLARHSAAADASVRCSGRMP